MRISDWSSDVCSSDLSRHRRLRAEIRPVSSLPANSRLPDRSRTDASGTQNVASARPHRPRTRTACRRAVPDRKSVVSGKRVSVRVDLGGRRFIKKKQTKRKDSKQSKREVDKNK